MKYMAQISNGKVVNVSKWNGHDAWSPNEEVVEIPTVEFIDKETGKILNSPTAGIGWDYIDGEFIDNRPVYDEDGNLVEPSEPKEEETTEGEG